MEADRLDFETCLGEAGAFHGEVCAGLFLGTRMAIIGLRAIGITDPKGADRKNIVVYVETDRCPSDAILAVTGCHPGKRTMKIIDHGKMAATFVNLKTGKAVRVTVRNTEGNKVATREEIEKAPHTREGLAMIPDDELFETKPVRVNLKPEDLPGKPLTIVTCESCGERVMDMREVRRDGKVLCRACAEGAPYYADEEATGA